MAITRWDPVSGLSTLERDLERMWSRMVAPVAQGEGRQEISVWAPTTDVLTRGDDLVIRAELPGVEEKDVDVSISDDILTIRGQRQQEKESSDMGYVVRESFHGSFERNMALPAGVEAGTIQASFNNGLLEVVIPKAASMKEGRVHHVPLTGGQGQLEGQQTSQQGQQGMQQGQQGMMGGRQEEERGR